MLSEHREHSGALGERTGLEDLDGAAAAAFAAEVVLVHGGVLAEGVVDGANG